MKPGVVVTALVVVAGAAGAVALFLKDGARLESAEAAALQGMKQLRAGEVDGAGASFGKATKSASQVSVFTGRRTAALEIANTAHLGQLTLKALAAAEEEPLESLRVLSGSEDLPLAKATLDTLRTRLLVEAASRLEAKNAVAQAEVLYARAATSAEANGSPLLAEAKRGRSRVSLLKDLLAAELALTSSNEEEAGRMAESARATLAQADSPFKDPTRVDDLRRRIEGILNEVASWKALRRYQEAVDKLYRRVNGPDLGVLLAEAQRLEPPKLAGGHPRAKKHEARKADLALQLERVRKVAEAFAGMSLAVHGSTSVFVDRTEVTNEAYAEFVKAGGYSKPEFWSAEGKGRMSRYRDQTAKPGPKTWSRGTYPEGEGKHPVTGVTYFEAEAYATWAGKRLPTRAEWRGAAGPADFPWGDAWDPGRANLKAGAQAGAKLGTKPVGSYPAGAAPTGALDMVGNAREIVCQGPGAYAAVGGSYNTTPAQSTAKRAVVVKSLHRISDVGFRCAKELKWDR